MNDPATQLHQAPTQDSRQLQRKAVPSPQVRPNHPAISQPGNGGKLSQSQQTDPVLTPEEDLPQDFDWNLVVQVEQLPPQGDVDYRNLDWDNALYAAGPDLRPALEGEQYYERQDNRQLTCYLFEFSAGPNNAVTARGRLHPVHEAGEDELGTITDTVLAEARLDLRAQNPRDQKALWQLVADQGGLPNEP